MFYYKVILSYKGSRYSGWQFQTENPKTVQAEVEKVLAQIVNHQDYKLMAASRTDTGVHANGQVLKIVLPKEIDPKNLQKGMNTKLPTDIRVIDCCFIESQFNANRDVISKEYHYYFAINKVENAVLAETINYIQHPLNLELMHKGCEILKGKHDFSNFCTKGNREVSTIREIMECSIKKTSFKPIEEEVFYLVIKSSGFLKYMVRYLMGALIEIGKEELTLTQLQELLSTTQHIKQKKAPAHGLNLIKINYKDD